MYLEDTTSAAPTLLAVTSHSSLTSGIAFGHGHFVGSLVVDTTSWALTRISTKPFYLRLKHRADVNSFHSSFRLELANLLLRINGCTSGD